MKLRSLILFLITIGVTTVLTPQTSFGTPSLQLDIQNGIYNSADETIYATSLNSTLYALLIPDKKVSLADTYYISIALTPITGSSANLGSFTFDGEKYEVTQDMTYGKPSGLKQSHGIFNTFYKEISFNFDGNHKTLEYNSEDNPGGLKPDSTGTMYYASFLFDCSKLAHGYTIHFDLYSPNGNAPFSHDASSAHAPIPGAVWLLGSGLLGILGFRRKFPR